MNHCKQRMTVSLGGGSSGQLLPGSSFQEEVGVGVGPQGVLRRNKGKGWTWRKTWRSRREEQGLNDRKWLVFCESVYFLENTPPNICSQARTGKVE